MVRLGWANRLTIARLFLLPFLLVAVLQGHWKWALPTYVLLGLTDAADGMVARRLGEESKIGFLLDPLTDILFHLGTFACLAASSVLSWWTTSLVFLRYGLVLGGCLLLYAAKGEIWIQPTPFGKATGLAISALTGLLFLLLGLGRGPDRPEILWIDRVLRVLFAGGVVHVAVIGWVNFRRPRSGSRLVYRRGWGLMVGRRGGDRGRRGTGPSPHG